MITVDKYCTIIPTHASYSDFIFGRAEYRLIAVYRPSGPQNKGDNDTFFDKIFDDEVFNTNKHIITAGDWNVGIFPQFNYFNYVDGNNYRSESRKEIIAGIEEYSLTDIFRHTHPDSDETCKQGYWTWKCKYNTKKVARLDYFLVSSNILPFVTDANIVTSGNKIIEKNDENCKIRLFSRLLQHPMSQVLI